MPSSHELENHEAELGSESLVDALPEHTWEEILARIPLNSLALSSCVCKRWRSFTTSPTFLALHNQRHDQLSWFYVNGCKYMVTSGAQTQLSPSQLQSTTCSSPDSQAPGVSYGPGGLCYVLSEQFSQQKLRYKIGALCKQWAETPEIKHARTMPIVGVVNDPRNSTHTVICVGGGSPCDGTQDSTSLKVEIFSSESKTWEECEDLPAEFKGLATLRSVTAVVCNQKMYVFHIYAGIVAAFDVQKRQWSAVRNLRPPGAQYCYLAKHNGGLLLIGVSYENGRSVFKGWKVDEATMECTGAPQPVVCFTRPKDTTGSIKEMITSRKADLQLRASTVLPNSRPTPKSCRALQYFLRIARCMPMKTAAAGLFFGLGNI